MQAKPSSTKAGFPIGAPQKRQYLSPGMYLCLQLAQTFRICFPFGMSVPQFRHHHSTRGRGSKTKSPIAKRRRVWHIPCPWITA